jgi:hypothetical protein
MRAKEYFEAFQEKMNRKSPSEQSCIHIQSQNAWEVVELFVEETKTLMKVRHIQNKNSKNALINEMNNKWLSLCRMCQGKYTVFQPEMFKKRVLEHEEFQEKKEEESHILGHIDSMWDVRELMNENKEKFKKLKGHKE